MKKNRSTLKDYFKKGAIPTEANFADLIDSMLNQDEDNISKLPNDPLKITAIGVDEALVNFYRIEKNEEKLSWQVKQKPDGKSGLNISDTAASRLFIENGTGNIGVGTTTPKQNLDVRGRINVEDGVIQKGGEAITGTKDLGLYSPAEGYWIRIVTKNAPINFFTDGGIGTKAELLINPGIVSVSGKLGIGTTTPGAQLDVSKSAAGALGGILRISNTGGSVNTQAALDFTTYDPLTNAPPVRILITDNGNYSGSIDFQTKNTGANANPLTTRLKITADGSVGIGVVPTAKASLEVLGAVTFNDGGGYALKTGFMASGSLTIGSINKNYGGGSGWNANTAGLLLEANANTEIAVHDSGTRVSSLMYYEGDTANRFTIGRDMGWGVIGSLILNGNIGVGTSTFHNPQGWNKVVDILGTTHARLNVRSSGGVVTSVFSHDDWSGARGVIGTDSNHPLTFATNYIHRMTIDTAGNVGIGTTGTPAAKLQVSGGNIQLDGAQKIFFSDTDTSNNLKVQLWTGYGLGINGSTLFYAANGNHSWRDNTGTNERMLLTTGADGGLTVRGTGASSFAGGLTVSGDLTAGSIRSKPFVQTFKVNGDADKFYPIVFLDECWGDGALTLEISRPNTHTDSEWRGSLVSIFTTHSSTWGHGAEFCRAEIYGSKDFIGGYQNSSQQSKLVVWLKGGGTTYFWRSNHRASLEDSAATAKEFGGDKYPIKTAVDSYAKVKQVYFSAYVELNDSHSGAQSPLAMKVTSQNVGGAYSTSTSKFTAPVKGLYLFTMTALRADDTADWLHWYLRVNDLYANPGGTSADEASERGLISMKGSTASSSRTVILALNINDTVWIQQVGSTNARVDNYRSGLEGVLLSTTA